MNRHETAVLTNVIRCALADYNAKLERIARSMERIARNFPTDDTPRPASEVLEKRRAAIRDGATTLALLNGSEGSLQRWLESLGDQLINPATLAFPVTIGGSNG